MTVLINDVVRKIGQTLESVLVDDDLPRSAEWQKSAPKSFLETYDDAEINMVYLDFAVVHCGKLRITP